MFADRVDAGRQLAHLLEPMRGDDVVVLGLPRGGVPVAYEIANELNCPLDVIVVRKIGVPWRPELAMGAIGEDGVRVVDTELVAAAGISDAEFAAVERRERAVLVARVSALRQGRDRVRIDGRTAVIVDDGIATGSSARAACQIARDLGAARVIVAVPVAPSRSTAELGLLANIDEFLCLSTPDPFIAVGLHYRDFSPPADAELARLLRAVAP